MQRRDVAPSPVRFQPRTATAWGVRRPAAAKEGRRRGGAGVRRRCRSGRSHSPRASAGHRRPPARRREMDRRVPDGGGFARSPRAAPGSPPWRREGGPSFRVEAGWRPIWRRHSSSRSSSWRRQWRWSVCSWPWSAVCTLQSAIFPSRIASAESSPLIVCGPSSRERGGAISRGSLVIDTVRATSSQPATARQCGHTIRKVHFEQSKAEPATSVNELGRWKLRLRTWSPCEGSDASSRAKPTRGGGAGFSFHLFQPPSTGRLCREYLCCAPMYGGEEAGKGHSRVLWPAVAALDSVGIICTR